MYDKNGKSRVAISILESEGDYEGILSVWGNGIEAVKGRGKLMKGTHIYGGSVYVQNNIGSTAASLHSDEHGYGEVVTWGKNGERRKWGFHE